MALPPVLSVIVPVYKVEETLNRCVESILRQGYPRLEVILIDDGSPDRCPQICDEWAQKDDRITVIHQPNGGLSNARNTGIAKAKGDFITFVDSDDMLADDTYRRLIPFIYASPFDILEFGVKTDVGTSRENTLQFEKKNYNTFEAYWFSTEAYRHCYVWNKIFRRRLFEHIRFPEGKVFEDVYIMPLLGSKADTICTTPEGTYLYHANPHGISSQTTSTHIDDHLQAHMRLLPEMLSNYQEKSVTKKDISLYYMYALNIQITHWRLCRQTPIIPAFRPNVISNKGIATLIKTILLQFFSPTLLCKLFGTCCRKP